MTSRFTSLAVLFASFVFSGTATQALGQPALCNATGNSYEIVVNETPICWTEAKEAAEAMGGHLATITSQEETDCIIALIDQEPLPDPGVSLDLWLGGHQPGGPEPEEGWEWVTGEPWVYTNWNENQPDNAGGGEDYLVSSGSEAYMGKWNDLPNCPGIPQDRHRYIVEYEEDQDCDDGNACTIDCEDGICVSIPIDCDDGDTCTQDSCDSEFGCVNEAIEPCLADLNGDCIVDAFDLAILLGSWGQCE